jgi:hypothetical protein
MLSSLSALHTIVASVCPIEGLSDSGVVSFAAEATQQQRDAAQAIVDGWLANDPTILAQIDAAKLVSLRDAAKQFQDDQQHRTWRSVAG